MENWNLQTLKPKPDNPTVQTWNIFKVIRVNHKPVYQPQTLLKPQTIILATAYVVLQKQQRVCFQLLETLTVLQEMGSPLKKKNGMNKFATKLCYHRNQTFKMM